MIKFRKWNVPSEECMKKQSSEIEPNKNTDALVKMSILE